MVVMRRISLLVAVVGLVAAVAAPTVSAHDGEIRW